MATKKKKAKMTEMAKKLMLAEVKRFVTMVVKYMPESKERAAILTQFEYVAAMIEEEAK